MAKEEGKKYRIYSKKLEGKESRTYCEGEVIAENERDAISKVSANKRLSMEGLSAEPVGQGCFVASAVYGDSNAHEVSVLREYRDNVLMNSTFGRRFVEWYYNGGGERIAGLVKGKGRFMIPLIRKGLDFIVDSYQSNRQVNSSDNK